MKWREGSDRDDTRSYARAASGPRRSAACSVGERSAPGCPTAKRRTNKKRSTHIDGGKEGHRRSAAVSLLAIRYRHAPESAPSCSRSSAHSKRDSVGASRRLRGFGSSDACAMNSAHENSDRCGSRTSSSTRSTAIAVAMATGSGPGAAQSSSTSSASVSAATCRAWANTDSTEPASSSPAPVSGRRLRRRRGRPRSAPPPTPSELCSFCATSLRASAWQGVPVGHEDETGTGSVWPMRQECRDACHMV